MKFLDRLKTAFKSLSWTYNWVDSNDAGNVYDSARNSGAGFTFLGSDLNWGGITNDFLANSTALACFQFLWRNMAQAKFVIETQTRSGETDKTTEHDLLYLISHPNPHADWNRILCAILHDMLSNGNAYLGIERNGRRPVELVYIPTQNVKPYDSTSPNRPSQNFDQWAIRNNNGQERLVAREDVLHFAYGTDTSNPVLGYSPFRAVVRQQFALDAAVNYGANIMRNFGVVGGLATPKTPDATFDPTEFVANWRERSGDGVGKMLAYDVPIQLEFPDSSPQKMTLETFADRPEVDTCAVFGVPPQVIGVHGGRHSKTYANLKEARESVWEETIIPLLQSLCAVFTSQLLPQMGGQVTQSVVLDLSHIRPLQPDLDALHKRAREDWQAKLIDRATWKRIVGMEPNSDDEGVYYESAAPAPVAQGDKNNAKA